MEHLPTPEEQQLLLFELSVLLRERGTERFLGAPVVEPTPRYFPEPWSPDEQGALAMTRRLLGYADLSHLDLVAVPYVEHPDEDEDGTERHQDTAAWFAGIDGGRCLFGIKRTHLAAPERLAGLMAHEVAHAYRHHFELVRDERDVEERLTDLTTIFLGLGILSANVSEMVRVEHDATSIRLSRFGAGYLTTESMAFLLAAQCVARGDHELIARVTTLLDSGPSVCFRAATRALGERRESLLEELGIVASATAGPTPFVAPEAREGASAGEWRRPWGRFAYRARRTRTKWLGTAGFIVGLFVALIVGGGNSSSAALRYALPVWPGVSLLGVLFGMALRRFECSRCGARMRARDADCPACLAYMLGTLHDPPARFGTAENRGRRVFRLRQHCGGLFVVRAIWIAAVTGLLLASLGLRTPLLFVAWLAAICGAWFIGARRVRYTCTGCNNTLVTWLAECPRCLGEVHGEVADATDRFEADEAAARRDREARPS